MYEVFQLVEDRASARSAGSFDSDRVMRSGETGTISKKTARPIATNPSNYRDDLRT
jgi:hypothetical protein